MSPYFPPQGRLWRLGGSHHFRKCSAPAPAAKLGAPSHPVVDMPTTRCADPPERTLARYATRQTRGRPSASDRRGRRRRSDPAAARDRRSASAPRRRRVAHRQLDRDGSPRARCSCGSGPTLRSATRRGARVAVGRGDQPDPSSSRVPGRERARRRPGIDLHRAALAARRLVVRDGLRVTSRPARCRPRAPVERYASSSARRRAHSASVSPRRWRGAGAQPRPPAAGPRALLGITSSARRDRDLPRGARPSASARHRPARRCRWIGPTASTSLRGRASGRRGRRGCGAPLSAPARRRRGRGGRAGQRSASRSAPPAMAGRMTSVSRPRRGVEPVEHPHVLVVQVDVHVAVQLAVLAEQLALGAGVLRGQRAQHLADVRALGLRPPSRRPSRRAAPVGSSRCSSGRGAD